MNLPTPPLPSTSPRQLRLLFDSARLRGMSPTERSMALSLLAVLLLQAADVAAGERDDDAR